jgi:Raf kinase inhibitor-like YbhB/YbcL family protein
MHTVNICILAVSLASTFATTMNQVQQAAGPPSPGLTLTSAAFEDGSIIPDKFTRSGSNPVSPPLEWKNVPEITKSFALLLHDPDTAAQARSEDTLHWIIFNIPGDARGLQEGIPNEGLLPNGTIQGKNSHGEVGFRGPGAPAAGPYHHYTFELYALDGKLALGPDATRTDVLKAMDGHIVGKAVLIGRFHR